MITLEHETVWTEIDGQFFGYEDIFSPIITVTAIDEQDAAKLFHKTKELFDEAGIEFAIVFGSLLGAVREGGHVIKGDQDMDIFIRDEKKLRSNLASFQQKGLKCCRILKDEIYSFTLDNSCYIDVYIMRDFRWFEYFPWNLYCIKLYNFVMPRKLFNGWEEIEFLGEKCLCPKAPEKLLEFWYGRNWRIPQDKKGIGSARSFWLLCLPFHALSKISHILAKILKCIFDPNYRDKILTRKKITGSFLANHR